MPANFEEIAGYHSRIATRHLALAHAAREAGDHTTANYQAQLAERYSEAAEEQKMAMNQFPGHSAIDAPRRWTPEPKRAPKSAPKPAGKHAPLVLTCLSALCRSAGSLAATIRQSLSSTNDSLQGLSLHDTPPAHMPELRG